MSRVPEKNSSRKLETHTGSRMTSRNGKKKRYRGQGK